ncbi:MAG: ABC transporter permease [Acidobacteriota bacterium]
MLKSYIKIAWKVFLRRKFFTFISLFAISVTLIVLMAASTILDHTLGSMPPETRLYRTLCVFFMKMEGERAEISTFAGYGFLDRYARGLPGVERMGIVSQAPEAVDSYVENRKITSQLRRTDGDFWKIMEFTFLEGAPFTVQDDRDGHPVAVINATTRERFIGGGSALGRSIKLGEQTFRVVGVVPDVPLYRVLSYGDVWVPIGTIPTAHYRTELVGDFIGLFLARSERDFATIRAAFAERLRQPELPDPEEFDRLEGELQTLAEYIANTEIGLPPKSLYLVVVLLMVLFMILPAVNLININVSRMLERSSEIGVRKAFGAASWTLVTQFVIENVLLTIIGGVVAAGGSALVLRTIAESGLLPYANFHFNVPVFLYGLALTLFFGVFSGVYPAWKMSRLHPVQALRGGVR